MEELSLKDRVRLFWKWFTLIRLPLEQQINEGHSDFVAALAGNELKKLGLPTLCEVAKSAEQFRLSLSPCGDKTNQFVTRFWAFLAPEVPGWQFEPFRRPNKVDAEQLMHITGNPWTPEQFMVYSVPDEEQHKFQLKVYSEVFGARSESEGVALCRMIFYLFLGEAYTEQFIGEVHCAAKEPQPAPAGERQSLPDFCDMVRRAPTERAWACATDPTTLYVEYGINGQLRDNDELREDIFTGVTSHPHLLSYPYAETAQLAKMGGAFCYLYYPVSEANAPDAPPAGMVVEQVRQLITGSAVGYVLGHAIGRDFLYIDVIVFDEPVFRALFQDTLPILGVDADIGYFGRSPDGGLVQ